MQDHPSSQSDDPTYDMPGQSHGVQPLDYMCDLATRLFNAESAMLLLYQNNVSRVIASHGLQVRMRSITWNFDNVPYEPNERYLKYSASTDSAAQKIAHEFGLKAAGFFIRTPVDVAKSHSLALVILGPVEQPKPSSKKLRLLDDLIENIREEFQVIRTLLTDPATDVTVAHTLQDVLQDIERSPHPACLLNSDLVFVAANQAVADLLGVPRSHIIGFKETDVIPAAADAISFLLRQAITTKVSPPDFEVITDDAAGFRQVHRLNVTPFSPTDTRDFFLFVTVQEVTEIMSHAFRLARAIHEVNEEPPPDDPSMTFLVETLVKRRTIRARNSVNYLSLRSWRLPIRDFQIKALKALKKNIPPGLPKRIADEIATEAEALVGRSAFRAIVPVPCGHSKGNGCLSLEIARALGARFELPVIQAFVQQSLKGSSHPKENTRRPALLLARTISEPVLLVDDVASSGAHIEEAAKLLKPSCGSVMSIVWIGGDSNGRQDEQGDGGM